jgi:hypothetical protein
MVAGEVVTAEAVAGVKMGVTVATRDLRTRANAPYW